MKRLIVCCDGTWNNPDQEDNGTPAPTNVVKIRNAIADDDPDNHCRQLVYYHPGVGGEGGIIKPIVGGAFGVGITRHICSAYHWLGQHYEEGDQIYLFGFSRGAFTARSIGGFLGRGLLKLKGLAPEEAWQRVHTAFKIRYRRKKGKEGDFSAADWPYFHGGKAAPIRFIGVWDTVGALGIPDDLEILNIFDDKRKWQFHDTKLGDHVQTARHAMAIDEVRSSFSITRWENAADHPDAKEIWFSGVHSDVGGGYAETDLSHGALLWMMEESHRTGLVFREGVLATIKQNPTGILHDSFKGLFAVLRSRPRNVDAIVPENKALFHPNVFERQAVSPIDFPRYHPTTILDPGESFSVDVFAKIRWNETGVYLPAGHAFVFTATGEWKDSKDACDWKGTQDGKLTIGDITRASSSFLGTFETLFKKMTKNESTDFLMTKRVEKLNWFTLVGAIANDAGSKRTVKNDGSPIPHQYVELAAHESKPLEIVHPGYLYCFPNDVWSMYENNLGSIQLTITRVS